MKVAITSTGNSLDSLLDQRFGRCAFFIIYDTQSQAIEIIPNAGSLADEGAGPAAVELLATRHVKKIVSGEFGIKIKPLLDNLKIQMIVVKQNDKKIQDIIDMLNH